jgi:hypothetical protein
MLYLGIIKNRYNMIWGPFFSMLLNKKKKVKQKQNPKISELIEELNEMGFYEALKNAKKIINK